MKSRSAKTGANPRSYVNSVPSMHSVVNPILSARAHITRQNGASFCRVEFALPSGIRGRVARRSAPNGCILSPPIEFSRSRQIATHEPVTTYELARASFVIKTQNPREPRTSKRGVFRQYATKLARLNPEPTIPRTTKPNQAPRSLRARSRRSSRAILCFSVLRGMPRYRAVAVTFQSDFSSARRMKLRSNVSQAS